MNVSNKSSTKPPNILWITSHDSGRHLGCYGHGWLETPALDRLATAGVQCNQCFCTVPICSPSRASQLTGLYPQSHGVMDLVNFDWALQDGVRHAGDIFSAAGYRTHGFGIQHEVIPSQVERLGFDAFHALMETDAGTIAESVVRFLKDGSHEEKPFFAQVGFFETHTPFDLQELTDEELARAEIPLYLADTEQSRRAMAGYGRSVSNLDRATGIILDCIRNLDMEEDTVIVFSTDHGIEMPRAKWHLYDPGIEMALLWKYAPGGLAGGRTCDALMSNVDLLPTLLEVAGLPVPDNLEGHSVLAALRGEAAPTPREEVYGLYQKTNTRYVRTDRYKLIRHFDVSTDYLEVPVRIENTLQRRVISKVELFDLESDPHELHSLDKDPGMAGILADLDTRLWRWMESVNDPLLTGPVVTPSYTRAIQDYQNWKAGKSES